MDKFGRLCRSEVYKMKNTALPMMHVLIPILGSSLFLFYYKFSMWNETEQILAFLEVVGIVFPFLVSIICARNVALEESNHFQVFLGNPSSRFLILFSKCIVLQLMAFCSVLLCIGSFALGQFFFLEHIECSVINYMIVIIAMWAGSLLQYPIHLYLNLRFSRAISMGVGVAQMLLAALLITGLGEKLWYFVPCSWSIRFSALLFQSMMQGLGAFANIPKIAGVCVLIIGMLYVIIFIWFHFYEGRQSDD